MEPVQADNIVASVANWVNAGFCVALYDGRYYLPFMMPNTAEFKIIVVDVSTFPNLMLDGELPWYIKSTGAIQVDLSTIHGKMPDHVFKL
jgi:hypothetical protein